MTIMTTGSGGTGSVGDVLNTSGNIRNRNIYTRWISN